FVSTQCQGLIELVRIRATERAGRFSNAVRGIHTQDQEITAPKLPCPEIFREEYGDLLPYLLEHSVEIAGEVRRPGIYPVAEDMSLESMVAVAGGFSREADHGRIEINRFISDTANGAGGEVRQIIDLAKTAAAAVGVLPADRINVQAKFTNRDNGPILLAGEFRYPGVYDISRGTRLSEVIRRAGGLTDSAYPYGAIFTRQSARDDEKQALKRYRQEIQDALTFGITRGGDRGKAIADAAPFLFELIAETEKAVPVGRIVVESDPTVLEIRPDLDPILQPGDQLFMPKRPSTVAVTGEVLNTGSFQFVSGASAKSYIEKAGGFQFSADKSKSFIVFPDGTARGLQFSAWRRSEVPVPPGSTIIVPRNIAPLDFLTVLPPLTTVLSQLALSAAALNTVASDD
ncbi:MAG TPA: polysaccharide biosynthesis/export protein, partial [Alphaproteobacteria bacterium]|nr:polysaccharide biosynthesis/export protein [Alphaproteobacteria bacterium]